jgi:hypothetical protein
MLRGGRLGCASQIPQPIEYHSKSGLEKHAQAPAWGVGTADPFHKLLAHSSLNLKVHWWLKIQVQTHQDRFPERRLNHLQAQLPMSYHVRLRGLLVLFVDNLQSHADMGILFKDTKGCSGMATD